MKFSRIKKKINFDEREKKFLKLLDKYRGKGEFDCVVPGSGGKDSCFVAHILKEKYGMKPWLWLGHQYSILIMVTKTLIIG